MTSAGNENKTRDEYFTLTPAYSAPPKGTPHNNMQRHIGIIEYYAPASCRRKVRVMAREGRKMRDFRSRYMKSEEA